MAIILSYSRKDESVVKALAQGLEAAKREVWFDHNLGGGDAWWDSILENIRLATVFLFALSDASLHSKPCQLELDYALALGRPIVPVQVGPVTSFRASPVAELQIISYNPDNAQSGFMILAAVDDAAKRVRPLPDPLPVPPPIPFAYVLALGRQIESSELSLAEQVAVIDQLRRALGEETDESVRQDILSMLRNLNGKPWMTKRTEREIAALLYAHGPSAHPQEEEKVTAQARRPGGAEFLAESAATPEAAPPHRPEPDPREWYAERLEQLQKQQAAAEKAGRPDPPPWRLPPDAAALWSRTFERDEPAAPAAGAVSAADEPDPTSTPPPPESPSPPPYLTTAAPQPPTPQAFPQQAAQQPTPAATWVSPGAPVAPPPPNYWALSIASCLFSLVLLGGGIAVYYSRQVDQRYRVGDLTGARKASTLAKAWGIVGIVMGGLLLLIAL